MGDHFQIFLIKFGYGNMCFSIFVMSHAIANTLPLLLCLSLLTMEYQPISIPHYVGDSKKVQMSLLFCGIFGALHNVPKDLSLLCTTPHGKWRVITLEWVLINCFLCVCDNNLISIFTLVQYIN